MNAFLQSHQERVAAIPADDIRSRALTRALAQGLPSPRLESWKYTSLRSLENQHFAAARHTSAFDPAIEARLQSIPCPRLVVVNGELDSRWSDISSLGSTVTVTSNHNETAPPHDDFFAQLHTAMAPTILHLNCQAYSSEAMLQLVRIHISDQAPSSHFTKLELTLQENASLNLVEHEWGFGNAPMVLVHHQEVQLEATAKLQHLRVSQWPSTVTSIQSQQVCLQAQATLRRMDLECGHGLNRNEIAVQHQGPNATLYCNGVLLGRERSHLETRLAIDHQVGNCTSHIVWRGLANDRSRVVFHGGIHIQKGADGSAAHLSNKNLLLNEHAEIDTQPVLEIDADEVQASHGATIGQLNEQALFYLRSRGIDEHTAKAILTQAFAVETAQVFESSAMRDAALQSLHAAFGMGEQDAH